MSQAIKDLLLKQAAELIILSDCQQLINHLPQEADYYISEIIGLSSTGAIFYHLQVSKHSKTGHVGKVFRGFDTIDVVMQTKPESPKAIAKSRNDFLDRPEMMLDVVLNQEC
ncbi:MAG: hypothetical protein JEY79_07260 [Pseudodesulfovibrio sp.]|nr:hypothetical protein [Pseudodesulfovibrio sp.]